MAMDWGNIDGMSIEELEAQAERLRQLARQKKVLQEQEKRLDSYGIDKNSIVYKAMTEAIKQTEEIINFTVRLSGARGVVVNDVLTAGIDSNGVHGHLLPESFMQDLYKGQVKMFTLSGIIPADMLAELGEMGCVYLGTVTTNRIGGGAVTEMVKACRNVGKFVSDNKCRAYTYLLFSTDSTLFFVDGQMF